MPAKTKDNGLGITLDNLIFDDVPAKKQSMDTWWKAWGTVVNASYEPLKVGQLIRTGILPFDVASGVGGLPTGCVVTLYGKEGSGKSTFWHKIAAAVQQQYPERIIFIIDPESSLDVPTLRRNGFDWSQELIDQHKIVYLVPSLENGMSYEKCIMMLEQLLRVAPDGVFAIIDSLDGMSTMSEIEKEASDGGAQYGGMAKANSIVLKRIVPTLRSTNSNLVVVQQLRDKINSMFAGATDTSGGHAIKHYSHIRIKFASVKRIGDKDGVILGNEIEAFFEKNRFHRPNVQFGFDLRYDYGDDFSGGIDNIGALLDFGKTYDLITVAQKGGGHTFNTLIADNGEPKKVIGREASRRWLIANPDKASELFDQIMEKVSNG